MKNKISIRNVTWKYFSVILLISFSGLLLLTRAGWQAINEDAVRHQEFETNVLQRQFSELISFYRGITEQLSRRTEVSDLLEFRDSDNAVVWAKEVRKLIPESIGVALIDPQGYILGEPLQLNLGTQCVNDLKQLLAGGHIGKPPIHTAFAGMEHFDIVSEVIVNGEMKGLLFASFSLDVIRKRANSLIDKDQFLLIESREGYPIAESGSKDHYEHLHTERESTGVVIDDTDWKLHYRTNDEVGNTLLSSTLVIAVFIFISAIAVMLVLSLKLISLFKKDMSLIKDQLGGVFTGSYNKVDDDRTVLSETADIMDDVWEIMGEIEQANSRLKSLSIKDDLSGLLNRRGFFDVLEKSWERSGRGDRACLVLLDLDNFKQVNDGYGHSVGDQVIIAMAQALKERCRKTDAIARLGGDEFAVILNVPVCDDTEQWYFSLLEIFADLQSKIETGSEDAPGCTISAGGVQVDKSRYDSVQKQVEAADKALYQVKEKGKGKIVLSR